jgi:2,5-furandicarboxylate decarboxylase 1
MNDHPIDTFSTPVAGSWVHGTKPVFAMQTAPRPPAAPSGIDMERFRLRTFIESLAGTDELVVHDGPYDLVEIAALIDSNPKAVLVRNVGPEKAEVVGNVNASRARLAIAFGVAPENLRAEIARRLQVKPQLVDVSRDEAPVQQVVLTGADADLTKLPIHLQHSYDGAPFVSASIDYAVDKLTGHTNVGVRRLMLRNRHETGIDLHTPSDLKAIYEAAVARGETLPISFVVGSHPIDYMASMMRLPGDELGLVSSLRDAPVGVVTCVTNDVRVPADAEYVIEGYLDEKGHREPEGPFGEFLGYYGIVKNNPVFHCTAITHRRDALFQSASISGKRLEYTDTAQLGAARSEVIIWAALQTAVREPKAIHCTASSGGNYNVRIAIKQRVPGEANNAIAAAFGCLANVKNVFIVDPDIDITSDAQMDWALATRFQADRDLTVMNNMRALPLDPSLDLGKRIGAKAGFDLTLPFGRTGVDSIVPEIPTYATARFASVRAALEDGPKRYEELMAATGSRDGREIVLDLEQLRTEFTIGRDALGRYTLAKRA